MTSSALTLAVPPELAEGMQPALELLRSRGHEVQLEIRRPRGPFTDIIFYVGERAMDVGIDYLLVEAFRQAVRSLRRRSAQVTDSERAHADPEPTEVEYPVILVVVDQSGEEIQRIDLTENGDSGEIADADDTDPAT